MKAVVLEVRDGQAIVLAENGETRKIEYSGNRGDEIEVADRNLRTISKRTLRAIRATAAVLAITIFGSGVYSYTEVQACSFVTLDVNPSFEYTLNRRDLVISVAALNEEAESFVEELTRDHIKGKTLSEAVEMTTDMLAEAGYFDAEEDEVLLTVTTKDQSRADRLTKEASAAVENKNVAKTIETKQATEEDRREAQSSGVSTGQYLKSKESTEKEKEENTVQVQKTTPKTQTSTPSSPAQSQSQPQETPAPTPTPAAEQPAVTETPAAAPAATATAAVGSTTKKKTEEASTEGTDASAAQPGAPVAAIEVAMPTEEEIAAALAQQQALEEAAAQAAAATESTPDPATTAAEAAAAAQAEAEAIAQREAEEARAREIAEGINVEATSDVYQNPGTSEE